MKTIGISGHDVRDFVGARSFVLGAKYFDDGAIHSALRDGDRLRAGCHGSYRSVYRVSAVVSGDGIVDADCTCPVGSGRCKHVAALLLAWARTPETFTDVRSTADLLAGRTREELIAIIQRMLRRRPELESILEAPPQQGKPIDPAAFRRRADAAFADAPDEWGAQAEVADELRAILDEADEPREAGRWADVAAVHRGVLDSVLDHYEGAGEYHDGDLAAVITDCVDVLGECLENMPAEPAARADILRALARVVLLDHHIGGIGLADGAYPVIEAQARPDERGDLVAWMRRENWDEHFVSALEEDFLTDEQYLDRCRQADRREELIGRLLKLGRADEASHEALRLDETVLPRIADVFVSCGHADAAEEWMRRRAARTNRPDVLHWLKDRCIARKDRAAALEYARREYQASPTLECYEAVRKLAVQLGTWDQIRAGVLALLTSRPAADKAEAVHALVKEGLVDDAIAIVRTARLEGMDLWLARTVERSRPDVAVEVYMRCAERLIDRRSRPNYREACLLLARVRDLRRARKESTAWESSVRAMRKRFAGLPALIQEMRSAKLIK